MSNKLLAAIPFLMPGAVLVSYPTLGNVIGLLFIAIILSAALRVLSEK
jgi:hypothetical protein